MGPPLTTSTPAARWPRRQSRLPPGWPVVLRGIDVAYDARIALGRVWQLYRIHVQAPTLPDGFRWRDAPMPVEVRELAEACGLILGPAPNRVVVACPTCDHEGALLHLTWGAWRCHACDRRRWSQLDQSLATYAHGLTVGLTGRPMVWRHRRILRAQLRLAETPVGRSTLVACLRRGQSLPHGLGMLHTVLRAAKAGVVLEYSPHWVRRHPHKGEPPLPRACLGRAAVEDAIDEYLTPAAYLTFVGGGPE